MKKSIVIPSVTFVFGLLIGIGIAAQTPEKENYNSKHSGEISSEPDKNASATNEAHPRNENSKPLTLPNIPDAKIDTSGFPEIPQGNARKYMKEAAEFLAYCAVSDTEKQACINEQARFEQEYVNAYAGDYLAQSNVAYQLWKSPPGFMPNRKRQACSWRLVIMTSGSPYLNDLDIEKSKEVCNGIDPKDPSVLSRAREIQDIVKSHKVRPVAVPAIEYNPQHDKDETNAGEGE